MKIEELKIYSNQIQEQTKFYEGLLGLEVIHKNDHSVSFKIGVSILTLEYAANITPYHFAINIPANKEKEALKWVKSRTTILKDGVHEIQDFDFWNAKAIYFYDVDNNIVELIARKNLDNVSNEDFGAHLFLEISEIGLPTKDVEREFNMLHQSTGIDVFSGALERFCAIGDERGLFICINKDKKDWFPTNEKAYSSDFELSMLEKEVKYHVEYKNEALKVQTTK